MTKNEKILSLLLILETFAIAALISTIVYIRSYVNEQLKSNLKNSIQISNLEVEKSEKADLSVNVSASLVWWDQDKGFESIRNNSKYLYSISPFWYELTIDGNIEPFSGTYDKEIIDYLKDNNILILPTISNEFEQEPLASIISDESKKDKHIEDILTLVEDYDGISLNYENLNAEDKENFSKFVEDLADKLHKNNKLLSIHLHAKTEEPGTWNGPQAQDWEALGKVADKLKIMAYDYHWSTSEAGAIAPVKWVEEVILHASDIIPKEKIYLGIPFYGYDWIEEIGEDVTYEKALTISSLFNTNLIFDDLTKSPHFLYIDSDKNNHEVWFENSESIKAKIEIAKKYKIGGIDFWRLGGEDPKAWEEIGNILKNN